MAQPQSSSTEWSRRKFVATAGAAALLAGHGATAGAAAGAAPALGGPDGPLKITFPPIAAPTEREEEGPPALYPPGQRIGYAVVGLGRLTLGQIMPAFAQTRHCRPVALVTGNRSKGQTVARQYGLSDKAVYDYRTFDRLRDDPAIQIVYIVLPNSMHAEFTVRAAKAGKHVLTEKPMATNASECEQMIAACRKAGRKLMVAYRIQYEPHHRMVRRLMDEGRLGHVRHVDLYNGQNQGDPGQWRLRRTLAGGGALPDIGLYCLNTVRYLTHEEPVELQASVHSTPDDPRFHEVEEAVNWTMRFPSGITASCGTSYASHKSDYYRVMGSDARIEMDTAFEYRGQRLRLSRKSERDPKAESSEEIVLGQQDQFALEMDHMAERVGQGDVPPFTPGEEGLQDHRLMAAIYQAASSGRTVRLEAPEGRDVFRGPAPSES